MKKAIILGLATAALSMTALSVSAESDDAKYPAANFQPKVVYIDKDLAKAPSKKASKKASAAAAENSDFDPKYPAAHFKPKVIYP